MSNIIASLSPLLAPYLQPTLPVGFQPSHVQPWRVNGICPPTSEMPPFAVYDGQQSWRTSQVDGASSTMMAPGPTSYTSYPTDYGLNSDSLKAFCIASQLSPRHIPDAPRLPTSPVVFADYRRGTPGTSIYDAREYDNTSNISQEPQLDSTSEQYRVGHLVGIREILLSLFCLALVV